MSAIFRTVLDLRDEFRYSLECIDILVRVQLLNMQQFDMQLAHSMDNGQNYVAVAFAMQLVQLYLIDDRASSIVTDSDLVHTVEVLARIAAHSRHPPDG